MEKTQNEKLKISLRVFITIYVVFTISIILWFYSFATDRVIDKQSKKELVSSIEKQCTVLANNIQNNDFVIEGEKNLNNEVDTFSNIIAGRVMVINSDYRVIKDTYGDAENSFILSKEVMALMTGDGEPVSETKDEYIQYIYPVIEDGEIRCAILVNVPLKSLDKTADAISKGRITSNIIVIFVAVWAAVTAGIICVSGINKINDYMTKIKEGHVDGGIPVKGFKEYQVLTENYNDTINRLMVIDSTRQEFVSNVSHELKTPITSMKVLADSLVQNEEANLEMYKEFMSDIVEEIDRETKIINDLLTLVKTDKKSAQMNIEEVFINELLEVILKRVTPIASSRGIEITYESYREVMADVDEVKLSLALTNLIENAVKYNVDNGWVKVTLNADHKYFHIKVADSGVGIPDDCKELVFDRFYRVDKARSRDTGGTGLGLAITKNVILMHKGTIKLYSESGEGTTFTMKIPLKYAEE